MSERNFKELLQARWAEGKFVCVGLDADIAKINQLPTNVYAGSPPIGSRGPQDAFNRTIVAATYLLVCAYKLNLAFYLARGVAGIRDLRSTVVWIHEHAPEVVVIIDAKDADVSNSSEGYADFVFGYLQADAVTVNPYLGEEALEPFLRHENKGVIVVCRTSNDGADEFQNRPVLFSAEERATWGLHESRWWMPLYQLIAYRVAYDWNHPGNCGLVVAGNDPEKLGIVRDTAPQDPILVPDGGDPMVDLEAVVRHGLDANGAGLIINASRSVIFAAMAKNFDEAAAAEVQRMNNIIRVAISRLQQ